MSSTLARIEIYGDVIDGISFGCPDFGLMGYTEIEELMDDIINKLKSSHKGYTK